MKSTILVITLFVISMSTLKAQHDVKTNALGIFFHNYGLGYEYIINDELSAGIYINSANANTYLKFVNDVNGSDISYSSFSIMPEFRYYTNPDYGADKRYFGGYMIYQSVNWDKLSVYDNETSTNVIFNLKNKGFGLGVITGRKWVTNSGIYFESIMGVGRFLGSNATFSDSKAEEIITNDNGLSEYRYISSWDFRFQIGVGYRIGGY